ncbi:MAG: hypothetical protein IT438_05660 [Phycisphaerales bacterium]|nr:hypothetical protein [Phycisphaerales bacterium]
MLGNLTPLNRFRRLCAFGVLGAGVLAASGCYSEGGLGWSEDQYCYVSRPYQPWTVILKDTRTGQELWSVEVPVGKQLVIHFLPGTGVPGSATPDTMEWGIMEEGVEGGQLANTLPAPPWNSRRLDPILRPVPEFQPGISAGAATGTGGAK